MNFGATVLRIELSLFRISPAALIFSLDKSARARQLTHNFWTYSRFHSQLLSIDPCVAYILLLILTPNDKVTFKLKNENFYFASDLDKRLRSIDTGATGKRTGSQ